jgi:oligopeptide/dipeptide ABC transporter ATP-binding protein
MISGEPMVSVSNLKKHFPVRAGVLSRVVGQIKAVDGIDLDIAKGEAFGLVGESGCGKSTAGRTILKLLDPTEGDVRFKGNSIVNMSKQQLRLLRREMQIIFQDPYGSLNPRMTVGEAIGEALSEHGIAHKQEKREKVEHMLEICGLAPYHYRRYPHEFSGGQRQRIGIARALVLDPEFIIADEPISALDVSIQSQIINLLEKLQDEFGLTFLFISHDLSVVKHICDRVAVMYLGCLVETAPKNMLYSNPLHPYTQALLSAVPVMDPTIKKKRIILTGDVPSPANPPMGCRFHTRCNYAQSICREEIPPMREINTGHFAACHLI